MALLLLLLVASLQTGSLQAAGLDLDSPQEQQLLAKSVYNCTAIL